MCASAATLAPVNLTVLPLAITMMAGPQIISALIFTTSRRAVPVSLAFLAGVALATTVGVVITTGLARLLSVGAGSSAPDSPFVTTIQALLVLLLIAIAIKNWRRRDSSTSPAWLETLTSAGPGRAFLTGLLLISLFPSDVVVLLTVGVNLAANGAQLTAALPFIAATVLIAALPLLAYLLLRQRAEQAMPAVRDWMSTHAWLINILACLLFIVLIVF